MKNITHLKERRFRTIEKKDENGKRTRRQEEYWAPLQVRDAQSGTRLAHYFIDGIVIALVSHFIRMAVPDIDLPGGFGVDFTLFAFTVYSFDIYSLIITLGYYTLFEYKLGATPAKLITGTRVIGIDGKRPSADKIITRTLIRLIPFEPLSFFGVSGWHDKWTETWVVSKAEEARINGLMEDEEASQLAV